MREPSRRATMNPARTFSVHSRSPDLQAAQALQSTRHPARVAVAFLRSPKRVISSMEASRKLGPTSNLATSDRSQFPTPRGPAGRPGPGLRTASAATRRRGGKLPMSAMPGQRPGSSVRAHDLKDPFAGDRDGSRRARPERSESGGVGGGNQRLEPFDRWDSPDRQSSRHAYGADCNID